MEENNMIVTRKPPVKETVGAQYVCFANEATDGEWPGTFLDEVEKTNVVKSVKVTENLENTDIYASGAVYDTDSSTSSYDIEVSVVAFPADTRARMRGETVSEGGLNLSGGNGERPYFAYGKVVKLKNGNVRFEWFPKCKLTDNSDEIATREDKFSEQTDSITIKAYQFDDNGNIRAYVDSSASNFPEKLTEELFFSKPILTQGDLDAVLKTTSTVSEE